MKMFRLPKSSLVSCALACVALLASPVPSVFAPAPPQGTIGTSVLNITPANGVTITVRQKRVTDRTLEADINTSEAWSVRGAGSTGTITFSGSAGLKVERNGSGRPPKVTLDGKEVLPTERKSVRNGLKYYSVGADIPSEKVVNLTINFEAYELVVQLSR